MPAVTEVEELIKDLPTEFSTVEDILAHVRHCTNLSNRLTTMVQESQIVEPYQTVLDLCNIIDNMAGRLEIAIRTAMTNPLITKSPYGLILRHLMGVAA